MIGVITIKVASVINLSEASGRVAAGLFYYQIYPLTIDTLVTGMEVTMNMAVGGRSSHRI